MRSLPIASLFLRLKFRGLQALCLSLLFVASAHAAPPNWAKVTPAEITAAGIDVQLTGADYGNGVFVLSTYFGGSLAVPAITPAVFTSADGTTWTRHSLPGGVTGRTTTPRFLNGKFFLGVQPDGAGNGVVVSSTDGITWTSSGVISSSLNAPVDFAYGNGVYVGTVQAPVPGPTQIITSSNGTTWTARSIFSAGSGGSVEFFGGKFYATVNNYSNTNDHGGLYSSADGVTWTKSAGAPDYANQLAAGTSTLLTTFYSGGNSAQAVSADGSAFTTASPGITYPAGNIRYLNGAFITASMTGGTSFDANQVSASTDGRTWAIIATNDNMFGASEIAYGNGRYVFVGEFNLYSGTTTVSPGSGGGGGTPAPTIGTQPASQTVALGGGVTFTVSVTGTGLTYQWYFNGVALSGQVNASLILSAITALNAGNYTVKITNAGGSVTSSAAVLTVATPSNTGRIVNMSVRGNAGAGDQTLIVGLVIGGGGTSGTKPVLVRAVGPTLGTMGVSGFLADPKLTAYSGGTAVATNDDWAGDAAISAAGARLGAQPFASAQSKDAAFYASPTGGAYTVHITGPATGIAMAEIYDGTDTATSTTPRLVNVSVRAQVGTGENLLITGFVIGGSTSRTVLLRALGPTLTAAGVNGVLADPNIALYSGGTKIAENDNWSSATNAATIVTTSSTVGAGPLVSGTKDAVLLVTLQPGVYTAHVTGVGNTTGVALVEVFEVP